MTSEPKSKATRFVRVRGGFLARAWATLVESVRHPRTHSVLLVEPAGSPAIVELCRQVVQLNQHVSHLNKVIERKNGEADRLDDQIEEQRHRAEEAEAECRRLEEQLGRANARDNRTAEEVEKARRDAMAWKMSADGYAAWAILLKGLLGRVDGWLSTRCRWEDGSFYFDGYASPEMEAMVRDIRAALKTKTPEAPGS